MGKSQSNFQLGRMERLRQITVLSLGAGVQSSAMALMAAHGEIEPMPDCAIFADTGSEPQHVYDQLDLVEANVPFPVYRVMEKDGLEKSIYRAFEDQRIAGPPFFTESAHGGGDVTSAMHPRIQNYAD